MRNKFKRYHEPLAEILRKHLRFSVKAVAEEFEMSMLHSRILVDEMMAAGYPMNVHDRGAITWEEGRRDAKMPAHKFDANKPLQGRSRCEVL